MTTSTVTQSEWAGYYHGNNLMSLSDPNKHKRIKEEMVDWYDSSMSVCVITVYLKHQQSILSKQ